ncbi:hypothetical protein [Streptosporangium vulgare]|uniref:hypothetical protein n=1 Tax=Streptosporangium vulgare TaxID=46190 RepID=UPI0031D8EA12
MSRQRRTISVSPPGRPRAWETCEAARIVASSQHSTPCTGSRAASSRAVAARAGPSPRSATTVQPVTYSRSQPGSAATRRWTRYSVAMERNRYSR